MNWRTAISVTGITFILALLTSSLSVANPVASDIESLIYLPIIFTSPAWVEVGPNSAQGYGISQTTGATYPTIAIASDNMVYVAWENETLADGEIYIRRWNGYIWDEVGVGSASGEGISDDSDPSGGPSIAIDLNGMPYVSWINYKHVNGVDLSDVYLRHWNGNDWEEVGPNSASGGGISNTGTAHGASLAISPDGSLYVDWADFGSGDTEVYILRWTGDSWEEVGENSASGGGISNTPNNSTRSSIATSSHGTPYVTWEEVDQITSDIYVRRWNGTIWEEVGEHSASGGGISNNWSFFYSFSISPSIAMTPEGIPYIVWADNDSGSYQIYIRRWNGTIWEEVGEHSASGGGISNSSGLTSTGLSMAINLDGIPYVTWVENGENHVGRYVNDQWETVGEDSPGYGGGMIAIDYNDVPYIVWTGVIYPYFYDKSIYILRWLE